MWKPVNLLAVLLLAVFGTASVACAESVCLKHDDDRQDGKRSITGAGHAVRFECPDGETWYVESVALHGSRYGTPQPPNEDFLVHITSEDMKKTWETTKPYSLFERGEEKWVRLDVAPVEVRGAFCVVVFFNPTRTKGVYVGIDKNSTPTHSMTVVPNEPERARSDLQGGWMIRAYVTKTPKGRPESLLDAAARAESQKKAEAARDAEILGSARSLTLKHDTGKMDDHMNIRGAVETVQFATPKNVEGYVWQVQVFASQFGRQHDSEAVNGDVYVLDENRKVITRTSFPYSLAKQQKGWITIPTLPTKVKGKFYVAVDSHGTKYKGLYMGYQKGNRQGKASTDEIQGDYIKPGDWSKRFSHMQWMIRVKLADRPVVYQAD